MRYISSETIGGDLYSVASSSPVSSVTNFRTSLLETLIIYFIRFNTGQSRSVFTWHFQGYNRSVDKLGRWGFCPPSSKLFQRLLDIFFEFDCPGDTFLRRIKLSKCPSTLLCPPSIATLRRPCSKINFDCQLPVISGPDFRVRRRSNVHKYVAEVTFPVKQTLVEKADDSIVYIKQSKVKPNSKSSHVSGPLLAIERWYKMEQYLGILEAALKQQK